MPVRETERAGCLPPFILLHGFAQTPATWSSVSARLRAYGASVDAVPLYDMRSASVPDRPLLSLADLCDAIADRVRKSPQPPVLVGYSMGGRLAAETLVRHPDLSVAALVLESAGLGPADDVERESLGERNRAWAARLRTEGVPAFMDWWQDLPLFESQRSLPESVRDVIRAERLFHDAEPLAQSLELWGAHRQASQSETLAALKRAAAAGVSVAYVAGFSDGKYRQLAERVEGAGLSATIVPNAGHNVHLERSDEFAALLLKVAIKSSAA